MIGQSNHETETRFRANTLDKDTSLLYVLNPIQVNSPQVNMHTLEENFFSKVRSEVDTLMTTGETRVQDAVMTALKSLVFRSVELALESVSASSGGGVGCVVLDPDQGDFSGNIEGLQMNASSRKSSYTDFKRTDETRSNITVEGSDLLVNERNTNR